MNPYLNLKEISAETLLNYLYPELEDKWIVRNEGTFYRNYNNDILDLKDEEHIINLSRDSFVRLLPQGFITPEDELKSSDRKKIKEIELRKKILEEAFLPVDSLYFRQKLKLEKEVSEILKDKLDYVLTTYFNYDLKKEENPYIREFAELLPYIRNRRGDLHLVKNMLRSIFACEIFLFTGRISATDSTLEWLPVVRYDIIKEDLDSNQYLDLVKELEPLKSFIQEWFIPVEAVLQLELKQYGVKQSLNQQLILGYNTRLETF